MNQAILIARPEHAATITSFQLKMALQTQNFKLDGELVSKAVNYFIDLNVDSPSPLGFYLVKIVDQEVVGSLLITFESKDLWWIQSVYVSQGHRCQGHFSSLFAHSINLAKQQNVTSVKLYAQNSNQRAKSTYIRLGMHIIPGKFYSYDFVYGQPSLPLGSHHYTFQQKIQQVQQLKDLALTWTNVLDGSNGPITAQTGLIAIQRQGKTVGVAQYFEEFSDWRFGIIRYVRSLFLEDGSVLGELVPELISELVASSGLKVAAVRFIASEAVAQTLKGGHLEHYDIMAIDLK